MSAVRQELPEGRYSSRSSDERADRKLKVIGAVLGAVGLGVVGWLGYSYVSGTEISAEPIKSSVVSDREVQVHLEIRKDEDASGTCTLRALAVDGAEVGRRDIAVPAGEKRIDRVYSVRTTSRATASELVSCTSESH
ncbi:DUF4307 domain-containing protein [Streptomyces sp. NPDC050504]|uniref:DUF4307 domain-containing protein n=1 Tax=Streptomyces sp. NPDC050504 TaxID=3365618 RepID=UPI0037BAA777